MYVSNILTEEANISDKLKNQFTTAFNRIKQQVDAETGIKITEKWLAGVLNQYNKFKFLDASLDNLEKSGKTDAANDTKARIVARDMLAEMNLFDKVNYRPIPSRMPLLSAMRQYYSQEVHAHNQDVNVDAANATRNANSQEYQEWFNSLSRDQQNIVSQLQEMNPEEMALFRGILTARKHKKQFVERLHGLMNNNEVGYGLAQHLGLISGDNKIAMDRVEQLREFLSGVTNARLKDIMSKSTVYAGKKIIHDTKRANNKVIKDIGDDPQGKFSLMIKLYHYIARRVEGQQDKNRAFRRMLDKIPLAHDKNGNPSLIGKGAYQLQKQFGGQKIDPRVAFKKLKDLYWYPADRKHRSDKATDRGESIRTVAKV